MYHIMARLLYLHSREIKMAANIILERHMHTATVYKPADKVDSVSCGRVYKWCVKKKNYKLNNIAMVVRFSLFVARPVCMLNSIITI